MSDYGHDLIFGSFITPSAGDPDRTVGIAVLAEQVGLDLVTFQDHPYQPAYLDTWTLLSFVAARTSRVHVAANVTNLPLRPPAVLARSVASLDLLSGGRVSLGLGAGAFWDAIEAMGGRRLTPGQGVRALEEGIEVIRQLWDAEARGGVRVDGEFYRVRGAKRGPAPAHPVPIWLGAYKPRMLQLTGRRGDGWLPTLGYLEPGALATGNSIIDDAAREAGRSPGDVRRLLNISGQFSTAGGGSLNGPAAQWAAELAELALTEGVSAFILASDDPTTCADSPARWPPPSASWSRPNATVGRPRRKRRHQSRSGPLWHRSGRVARRWPAARSPWCRPPTTACGAATSRPGTSRPGRPDRRPSRSAPTPRTSRPPPHISCRSTTVCAPSWRRSTI
ncbi:LLM class flavin-dependent oxidoreductase [Micromonospora tarensis]|uniref:LLM class flavin-dependent oxidoreductase n=1 Tax=Micromonospora tarensis TaxID=2806100 RepID=UPI001EE4E545|nr:LLM class flavin-dependent oxidoreductase [Micromonospora tarensis]